MQHRSNFERFPRTVVSQSDRAADRGFTEIRARLAGVLGEKTIVCVECYPGVRQEEILEGLLPLGFDRVIHSDDCAFAPEELDNCLERDMTKDPVFGIMTVRRLEDFFYSEKLEAARATVSPTGRTLIYGVGASLVAAGDITILADITRWEIQLRYRKGMTNWRTARKDMTQREKYKRGFFAEWRWADKVKDKLLPVMDYYLDMTNEAAMVEGDAYRDALRQLAGQPFRLVPYFDPGVWGGDWMKEHFDLPENGSNYAWSFDGVPEENSLLLDFGGKVIETPALNLVYAQPQRLLGQGVHARFGKEFPIRFDMLDTMHGQNLSLQVHPLTEYIQQNFNMHYTQDESYYLLDAQGDDPCVYLGIKTGINPQDMARDLRAAQRGEGAFPAERYVNRIPVKKHDHLLIPAGTVHCSGADTMVLEISATPYIFTFKLWDWGRVDLDGKPRPIHIDRGLDNIQWDRNTEFVKENLVDAFTTVHQDETCLVERTGLHEREFIDTFRVSTSQEALIHRNGSVHVMNLVDGERARIISPTGAFQPFELHYAETCILPEAAGEYRLCAPDGAPIKAIIACVRN
ncbi:MAG: class I mannose-6-phosphate isomerase [Candidatus Faecousia sp.]|nr:class I mannose-6-phosphate isomerase [Bacillota bacterium]MDY4219578.1 class I mannose-6-phosphate isomerase [Candidatus Faecousia sp.]